MYIGCYNIDYWSDYFNRHQVIVKQVNSYYSKKKIQTKYLLYINTF